MRHLLFALWLAGTTACSGTREETPQALSRPSEPAVVAPTPPALPTAAPRVHAPEVPASQPAVGQGTPPGPQRCVAEPSIDVDEGWIASILRVDGGYVVASYQSDRNNVAAGEIFSARFIADSGNVQSLDRERVGTFVHPDRRVGAPALLRLTANRYLAVLGSSGGFIARFFGGGAATTLRLSEPGQVSAASNAADVWRTNVLAQMADQSFAPTLTQLANGEYRATFVHNVRASTGAESLHAVVGVVFSERDVLSRTVLSRPEDNAVAPVATMDELFYLDARRALSNLISARFVSSSEVREHRIVLPLSLVSEPAQFAVDGERVVFTAVGANASRSVAMMPRAANSELLVLSPSVGFGSARRVHSFAYGTHSAWVFDDVGAHGEVGSTWLAFDGAELAPQRIADGRMPRVDGLVTPRGLSLGIVSVRRAGAVSRVLLTRVSCSADVRRAATAQR